MAQQCEHHCQHYGRCMHQRLGGICVGWEPYPEDDDDEDSIEQQLERSTY